MKKKKSFQVNYQENAWIKCHDILTNTLLDSGCIERAGYNISTQLCSPFFPVGNPWTLQWRKKKKTSALFTHCCNSVNFLLWDESRIILPYLIRSLRPERFYYCSTLTETNKALLISDRGADLKLQETKGWSNSQQVSLFWDMKPWEKC